MIVNRYINPVVLSTYTAPNAYHDVYRNIDRLLTLTSNMENSDLALEYDRKSLTSLIMNNQQITAEVYEVVRQTIGNARIRYIISEIPKHPWG